jgi:hypothetical protein
MNDDKFRTVTCSYTKFMKFSATPVSNFMAPYELPSERKTKQVTLWDDQEVIANCCMLLFLMVMLRCACAQ